MLLLHHNQNICSNIISRIAAAVCLLLGGCNAVVVAFVVLNEAATPTHNIKYSISAYIFKWFYGEMSDRM